MVRPKRVHWYGWQPLLFDVGATGLGIAALAADSVPVAITSAVVSILGAPAVHLAHGRYGTAALDVSLRALPVVVLAYALPRISNPEDARSLTIAAGVFQVLVIVVDSAWLSRETVDVPPDPSARIVGGGVLALPGGGGLSLSGIF